MTARKASAKKKKPAPPKRKAPTKLAVPPPPPPPEPDWPKDLPDDQAKKLFDAVEDGMTIRAAAKAADLAGSSVYRWMRRHKDFGVRMEEAQFIGDEMMADEMVELADMAIDRDTAAAAKEKREARKDRLRWRQPRKFNTNPFKAEEELPAGMMFGVIVVPAKSPDAGLPPPKPVIDATATRVQRVPAALPSAPKFELRGIR